jgi:hypothetical protein
MNDREFRRQLQAIAHGEEPPQARERPSQKELPTKKAPDKAKRSTLGKLEH